MKRRERIKGSVRNQARTSKTENELSSRESIITATTSLFFFAPLLLFRHAGNAGHPEIAEQLGFLRCFCHLAEECK